MEEMRKRLEKVETNIQTITCDISSIKTDTAVVKNNIGHIIDSLKTLPCQNHSVKLEKTEIEVAELKAKQLLEIAELKAIDLKGIESLKAEHGQEITELKKIISNIKMVWMTITAGIVLVSTIITMLIQLKVIP